MHVDQLLTITQLARAIGVSESSLKRWADDGVLRCHRTVGGHRRVPLSEAVRFIREIGAHLVRPDLIGLNDLASVQSGATNDEPIEERLYGALEAGRAAEARGHLQSLYLAGWSVADIFDGPLWKALGRLGELWLHAEWGMVVEHRATTICVQAISQLGLMIRTREPEAPVAVGAAAEHDMYMLPSMMASVVLGEAGFADVNLGPLTPEKMLINASAHYRARVAWLSVSYAPDPERCRESIVRLGERLAQQGTTLVVGGRAIADVPSGHLGCAVVARSMRELLALGRGLRAATLPARDPRLESGVAPDTRSAIARPAVGPERGGDRTQRADPRA